MYQRRDSSDRDGRDDAQQGRQAALEPRLLTQLQDLDARGGPRKVKDFLRLLTDAQRSGALAWLQQQHGNAYVQEMLSVTKKEYSEEDAFRANEAGFAAKRERDQAVHQAKMASLDAELAAATARRDAVGTEVAAPADKPSIEAAPAPTPAAPVPAREPDAVPVTVAEEKKASAAPDASPDASQKALEASPSEAAKGMPSERDIYETNASAMGKKWESDALYQRAMARRRGEKVEPTAAPTPELGAPKAAPPLVVAEAQHEQVVAEAKSEGLGDDQARKVAREVEVDKALAVEPAKAPEKAKALEEPAATPAATTGPSERDIYMANAAAAEERTAKDEWFQRAMARHRDSKKVEPVPGQAVEEKPVTPEDKATAEKAVAHAPVVKDAVTKPPEAAPAPVPVPSAGAVTLSEALATSQAAATPASTTQHGIDRLNNQGAYDFRMGRVQQIRNDVTTGSVDQISPDVSAEVLELMKSHIHGITDEQMVAIQGYTSQDYEHLNAVMREPGHDPEKAAALKGYCDTVGAGLAALPDYEGEVYRGTAMSDRIWRLWEQAHASGGTVADAAFSSSSKSEDVAEDFLRNNRADGKVPVFCRIQSRSGKQIEFLSKTANEAEVLFKAGAKFKIVYIEDSVGPDGQPRKEVFLREVADESGAS